MSDADTTVERLRDAMRAFVAEREWEKFHTPKNLAMSLAIEAAELMEHFQWLGSADSRAVAASPDVLAEVAEPFATNTGSCGRAAPAGRHDTTTAQIRGRTHFMVVSPHDTGRETDRPGT